MSKYRQQTEKEEILNGYSHAIALGLFLLLSPLMFSAASGYRNGLYLWTLWPFYAGIISTYAASSAYHFTKNHTLKNRLRIWDHISIFILIGGTYTPVIMQYTRQPVTFIFLGIIWGIILIGTLLKLRWTGKYNNISTALYVFLGWMFVFVIFPVWKNAPPEVPLCLAIGGLSYTVGVFFYKKSGRLYFHAVWHLFVFMGTLFHWLAILVSFNPK